jgi:hypothetical protein
MGEQGHDGYGKLVLRKAARADFRNVGPCVITSYGKSCAHIDGTVGSTIAVEVESRTSKQVRGAVLDLILHTYPKKLMILIPMYIGKHQVAECEFILNRFVGENDFRVVLLDGTGHNPSEENDISRVKAALNDLGWDGSPSMKGG